MQKRRKFYKIKVQKVKKKGTKENAEPKSLDTLYIYIYISTKFNQRIRNKIDTNKIKIYSKKKPVIDTG